MDSKRPQPPIDDPLEKELERLRANFIEKLPGRLQELTEHWLELYAGQWEEDRARDLHRAVHGLIGTAGSLGFPAMAGVSRRLERQLIAIIETGNPPTDHDSREVLEWFERITEASAEDARKEVSSSLVDVDSSPEARLFELRNLIVVVEKEGPFATELVYQLGHFGFELQMYKRVQEVVPAEIGRRPAAVIVDLSSPTGDSNAEDAASEVRKALGDEVPLVFVSNRSDIEIRLDAVRAGCSGFFVKPVNYGQVLETLDRLTRREPDPFRILIVDDEEESAEYHAGHLRAAGLEAVILINPLEVISHLVEFRPDVILMDVYMPGCSGIELAKVIRQEEAFVGVPIVFLSVEQNRMKQIAALGHGGDDFFTKPVPPEQLVPAVQARASRGRTLRLFMERDGLTGLYSHSRIIEQLEVAVRRAERADAKLAVAMLDIDGFKQVNDGYGHLVGDQVLKALAYLLRQRLRISDILGRFGGDEFVVVMPDTDGGAAADKMDDIRKNFAAVEHDTGEGTFSASLSCGVAALPAVATGPELIAMADEALYEAKRAGRNRVVRSTQGG